MSYKIDYFDSFECIGGSCQNTCCRGWNITIDEETYDFYKKQKGEFGEFLGENVYQSGQDCFIKMTEERLCPFLDENKLCQVYREYGPEHQSETCQSFPRIRREDGSDMTFHMLSFSCEEVLRRVFYHSESVHLNWEEEKMDYSVSHPTEIRLAEFISWSMELIQDESLSLDLALGIVLYFGMERIEDIMDMKKRFCLPSNEEVHMILQEFQSVKQDMDPKELEYAGWEIIYIVIDTFCHVVHETDFYNKDAILWDPVVYSYSDDRRKSYLYEEWQRNKNNSFPTAEQKRRWYTGIIAKHLLLCGVDSSENIVIARICNYILVSEIMPCVWNIQSEADYFAKMAQIGRLFEHSKAVNQYINPIVQKLLQPDILSYILAFMVLF